MEEDPKELALELLRKTGATFEETLALGPEALALGLGAAAAAIYHVRFDAGTVRCVAAQGAAVVPDRLEESCQHPLERARQTPANAGLELIEWVAQADASPALVAADGRPMSAGWFQRCAGDATGAWYLGAFEASPRALTLTDRLFFHAVGHWAAGHIRAHLNVAETLLGFGSSSQAELLLTQTGAIASATPEAKTMLGQPLAGGFFELYLDAAAARKLLERAVAESVVHGVLQLADHRSVKVSVEAVAHHEELLLRAKLQILAPSGEGSLPKDTLLRHCLDSSSDFFSLVDKHHRYAFVNRKYSEHFARNTGSIIGRHVAEILGEDVYNDRLKERLDRVLGGATERARVWITAPTGEPAFVDTLFSPYRDEEGKISHVIAQSRDLTGSHVMAMSQYQYEHMLDAFEDMVVLLDEKLRVVASNESFRRLVRTGPRIGDGAHVRALPDNDFWTSLIPACEAALKGKASAQQGWFDLPAANRRYLEPIVGPYREAHGDINGVLLTIRDRTRRKLAEAAIFGLATSPSVTGGEVSRTYDAVVEAGKRLLSAEAVHVWLRQGSRWERFDHYRHSKGLGNPHSQPDEEPTQGADNRMQRFIRDTLSRKRMVVATAEDGGEDAPLLASINAPSALCVAIIVAGEVEGALVIGHHSRARLWTTEDRTLAAELSEQMAQCLMNRQRKRLEARLALAEKLESLGVLAGGIAHDFNNLLVAIMNGTDMALHALPKESSARSSLSIASEASQRASELCNQLLAYAGKRQPVLQLTDITQVITDTIRLMSKGFAQGASIRTELATTLPALRIDSTQLRQVLTNLIANSVDAMEGGALELTVRSGVVGAGQLPASEELVLAPDRKVDTFVSIEVEDHGVGMDEETRGKMFDPFYSTKFTGRGLGLSSVLGIIRAHHGGIAISSQVGLGTRIQVLFPVSADAPRSLRMPGVIANAKATILLVDDETLVRSIAAKVLERAGYEVKSAGGGPEAIEVYKQAHSEIDLVILDMRMPEMDGDETARKLYEISSSAKVVLSSGLVEENSTLELRQYGVRAFLRKPYHARGLLETVARVLHPKLPGGS